MIQEVKNDDFQREVLASQVPVIVDFWSPGCGPCRLQEPILHEIDGEAEGRLEIRKVNVWDEAELASRYNVNAVPTLLIFQQGQVVKTMIGYQDKNKLLRAFTDAVSQTARIPAGQPQSVAIN